MKKTNGERAFAVVNYIVLTVIGLLALMPFLNVIAKSVSTETAVVAGRVSFYPIGFQLNAYKYVLQQGTFLSSLQVSLFITAVGTLISMVVTILTAYPLSKRIRGRKWILLVFIFTMLFKGGIIPDYFLMRGLGLLNNVWSLIFPHLLIVFNMLVMKSFFETLPESLEEAAIMDGAGYLRIVFSIVVPLSLPVIATITLFYAVAYWNNFFFALLYITRPDLKPLQLYLFEIITESKMTFEDISINQLMNISPGSIRAATVIVSTVPILLVYPYLQRHFVKGLIIGSVKG
jgi:putative aldouronate transport system permease protein